MKDLATLGRFGVVLADPPWAYSDLGHSRRIDKQYPTMTLKDICALPVTFLFEPDCVLFLWVTATLLFPNASAVMDAWGFTYKTGIVWDKEKIGMGHYTRTRHEHLLIATRGRPGTAAVHNLPSVITSPRGAHSVKPIRAYEYIEAMFPEPRKVELFARATRPGWTAWGNEIE